MSQGSVLLGGDWHVRGNSCEACDCVRKEAFFLLLFKNLSSLNFDKTKNWPDVFLCLLKPIRVKIQHDVLFQCPAHW